MAIIIGMQLGFIRPDFFSGHDIGLNNQISFSLDQRERRERERERGGGGERERERGSKEKSTTNLDLARNRQIRRKT